MLTEIEWWGGLLFLWWAASYTIISKTVKEEKFSATDVSLVHLTFLASAVVLALYFYPLHGSVMKYAYMAAICVGVLATAMQLRPSSQQDDGDKVKNNEQEENAEEVTGSWLWLVSVILYFPNVVSLVLGAVKSIGLIGELG